MLDNLPETAWWALTVSNRRHLPCKGTEIVPVPHNCEGNAATTNGDRAGTLSNSRTTYGPLAVMPEGLEWMTAGDYAKVMRALDFDAPSSPPSAGPKLPWVPEGHIVYFVGGEGGPIKIGWTQNLKNRMRSLQNGSGVRLTVWASQRANRQREHWYHKLFAKHRLHGEWFARCPEIEAEIARLTPNQGNPA